jgi:hypothetical protein
MIRVHRLLALCLSLTFVPAAVFASTRVGVYAIVDEVTLEPDELAPNRIWISGVFVVPVRMSSGLHEAPRRGHLYFSLNPDFEEATRRDWQGLKEFAGTGRVVGFGEYWVVRERTERGTVNSSLEVEIRADRTPTPPQSYPEPSADGIVSTFDSSDDLCPRFGKPSSEIVVSLLQAHAPNAELPEFPICPERIGVVDAAELDTAYLAQAREPEWANSAESTILQRIADSPGLVLTHFEVDCRETICRVRFAFPSREYQQRTGNTLAARALHELPGFVGGSKVVSPRDRTPMVDYYIQRRRVAESADVTRRAGSASAPPSQ